MSIAFLDFDGTITHKDTFLLFIKFVKGRSKFWWGMFIHLPVLIGFKIGLLPNWKAKEIIFSYFFKNEENEHLLKLGEKFATKIIPDIIRPEVTEAIRDHRKRNSKIVIVSASFSIWLKPWCEKNGFDLLATEHEIRNKKVTGKIMGKNCHGIEKARRIQSVYRLNEYEKIYAYGDSHSDQYMLDLADINYLNWEKQL